ncbi:alpha/beta hydrolase [Arthrobacter sunyaminii]|uniref:Alpha/beta fold hydrolase n=1 Tax=Arthrobacter sunyaminii TaxID=2816859 RepID=A0A975S4P7_9MICC|nr:alpha/beta hydrolase [Arthrobacter sunyaminii]MBO0907506.1 alpha/beta hydrolase [Arthrobacter sunyaminii]QWQ35082.1 alpha/beta fold hydrolase [Arthrobacter sunyaminii]
MTTSSSALLSVGDIDLCVETSGDPRDPPVLLIAGMSASMLWWPVAVCEAIAAAGFFVIRFDQRDTGVSTSFPVGRPGYSTANLAADALGICDSLRLDSVHVVGHSLGSGIATILALDHPERVRSLTLMGASTGAADLPPAIGRGPELPDGVASRSAAIEYLLEDTRACDGLSPRFDEDRIRKFLVSDVDRAVDIAATISNPPGMRFVSPEGGDMTAIAHPTLVVHGELDSLFPLAHGEAVAHAIPGASLVVLPGAGHTLLTADTWDFTPPVIGHLRAAER